MWTEIEAYSLFLLTHTQIGNSIDHFQNIQGPHKREHHGIQYGQRLDAQLCWMTIEQPIGPCRMNRLRREETGRSSIDTWTSKRSAAAPISRSTRSNDRYLVDCNI